MLRLAMPEISWKTRKTAGRCEGNPDSHGDENHWGYAYQHDTHMLACDYARLMGAIYDYRSGMKICILAFGPWKIGLKGR
jgi:hypothetical protein